MDTVTTGPAPDLGAYDIVLVNSSAGKDSQASLDVVVEHARAANALAKIVVVHADLGDAEWDGVPELAAEHAAHYGLRFELARRTASDGHTETILERVATRGMWPDAARRWCTSDHKRGPIRKVMTSLVAELRDNGTVVDRPVRLLNVMGLRAAESTARARRVPPYTANQAASNGRRHVDEWYPIHHYTVADVWARIAAAGTRPRPPMRRRSPSPITPITPITPTATLHSRHCGSTSPTPTAARSPIRSPSTICDQANETPCSTDHDATAQFYCGSPEEFVQFVGRSWGDDDA